MKKVTVSAPGKLMIMGEHAVVHDHPCIVTAVDQRIRATVELSSSRELLVDAPDVSVLGYKKSMKNLGTGAVPREVIFVELAVKNFSDRYAFKQGVRIKTSSEFSSKLGFGSSSAATVCIIKALSELTGKQLDDRELFKLAYKTVLDVQGKGSGFDVASAIYGGTIYFVTGGSVIESLDIQPLPIVIGYSGVKADTVTLINAVNALHANQPEFVDGIYRSIAGLVEKAKCAIKEGNWHQLGLYMNENQKLLEKLGVSTDRLRDMIRASIHSGAYGAKLSGAGGGDCMFALVSDESSARVQNSIFQSGGEVITIQSHVNGVRTEE